MSGLLRIAVLAAALSMAAQVQASQYDTAFGAIQRMLAQSVANDEAGLSVTQRQLEDLSRPVHQNVKEARVLNQQGPEALKRNDYAAAGTAFQQAQIADPADVEVAGNLGML